MFWYLCPHCRNFESELSAWAKKLPSDVAFSPSPVTTWGSDKDEMLAKIFYVEKALGSLEKTHKLMFDTAQDRTQNTKVLKDDSSVKAWFLAQGIDEKAFTAAWGSFSVATEVKKAAQRQKDLDVHGVPVLIVNGKYRISGREGLSENQAHTEMLAVAEFLIVKERLARK